MHFFPWIFVCFTSLMRLRSRFSVQSGAMHHLAMSVLLLTNVPWRFYRDPVHMVFHPPLIPTSVHAIYAVQTSLHLLACFLDPHGDKTSMRIHHASTLVLLLWSWTQPAYMAYGVTLMLIHDVSDVFIYWLRAQREREGHEDLEKSHTDVAPPFFNEVAKVLAFTGVVLSWVGLRLIWLGCLNVVGWFWWWEWGHAVMLTAMSVLWCLNFYWLILILRKARHEIMKAARP